MSTYAINPSDREAYILALKSLPHTITDVPHAIWSAKIEGHSVNLYKTHKLLIQGKNPEAVFAKLQQALSPELSAPKIIKSDTPVPPPTSAAATCEPIPSNSRLIIGSDESGKGDLFGPLVVTACHVPEELIGKILSAGVKDSKQLTAEEIDKLATMLKEEQGVVYHTVLLKPSVYNGRYLQHNNLNKLMAAAHAEALCAVSAKIGNTSGKQLVVDKFDPTGKVGQALSLLGVNLPLTELPKAENQFPSVAAASIIARSEYNTWMDKASKHLGFTIPKGANFDPTPVLKQIQQKIALEKVGKTHFAPIKAFLASQREQSTFKFA